MYFWISCFPLVNQLLQRKNLFLMNSEDHYYYQTKKIRFNFLFLCFFYNFGSLTCFTKHDDNKTTMQENIFSFTCKALEPRQELAQWLDFGKDKTYHNGKLGIVEDVWAVCGTNRRSCARWHIVSRGVSDNHHKLHISRHLSERSWFQDLPLPWWFWVMPLLFFLFRVFYSNIIYITKIVHFFVQAFSQSNAFPKCCCRNGLQEILTQLNKKKRESLANPIYTSSNFCFLPGRDPKSLWFECWCCGFFKSQLFETSTSFFFF